MCGCSADRAGRPHAGHPGGRDRSRRTASLARRSRRSVCWSACDDALALFAADGSLLHATPAAQAKLGRVRKPHRSRRSAARRHALAAGRAEGEQQRRQDFASSASAPDASTVLLAHSLARASPPKPPQPVEAAPRRAPLPIETITPPPNRRHQAAGARRRRAGAAAATASQRTSRQRRRDQPRPAAAADAVAGHWPSAASRFASSGRWTATAASRSTPTSSWR